jgi:hypothetical protein
MRFNWTPQEVDAMDPDFIDELAARLEAEVIRENKPKPKDEK